MKVANLKTRVILLTVLLFFPAPALLDAAEFKLKPLVVTGDSAPGGETFFGFGVPHVNSRGGVAFGASTASGSGR